ncbi:MAG: DUF58 domain-containing protein [Phycisphaerales bacterium]
MPESPRSDAVRIDRLPEVDASLYLHPQTLAKLGSFELRAKMIVEGISSGAHRSPFQGFSVEFAQHRPYVPGDDIRHLDWKVYARTDRLQLKQYQQETNLDLVLLVDSSGSMMYGSRSFGEASGEGVNASPDGRSNWAKYDHATALAAALSYITLRQGDRVGLLIFADEVRAALRRSSSQGTWRQIVGALATHPVDPANKGRRTSITRMLEQAVGKLNNRCLVALISDLFFDLDELRETVAQLRHARHDLIVFQVLDREEERFGFEDAAPFLGLEGEPAIRIDPRALRKAYLEVFEEHRAGAEKLIKSFGYDYQRICTHDWLGPPLASFVARRNAMMRRSKYG